MMTIFSEAMLFASLVSFFTLGLSAASGKGAVLYPFVVWLNKKLRIPQIEKKEAKLKHYLQIRRGKRQPSMWVENALEKLYWIKFWRKFAWKPIILCVFCMPSFWGTTLFWILPLNHWHWWIWIVGVPISAAINKIVVKLVKSWP